MTPSPPNDRKEEPRHRVPWLARLRIAVGGIRQGVRLTAVDLIAFALCRGRVSGGVFSGMRCSLMSHPHAVAPKVIGAYEVELLPLMTWVAQAGFARLVNIGSAEGYYCVGLARAAPALRVEAFEMDPAMQRRLAGNARRNGVEARITQHGRADRSSLEAVLANETEPFVLVDIEGGERELLDPAAVPALARAWMLVELHPAVVPDVAGILRDRFAGTHAFHFFAPQAWEDRGGGCAHEAGLHWLARFPAFRAERRGEPTPWLLLRPHTGRPLPGDAVEHARPDGSRPG